MSKLRHVITFIYTKCACGEHFVPVEPDGVYYYCNACGKTLVFQDNDNHLYIVGERIL